MKGEMVVALLLTVSLLFLVPSCAKRRAGAVESVMSERETVQADDDYPSRPVTVIVAYKKGGGTDMIARRITEKVEDEIGTEIRIKNISGSDGELGYTQLAKASPDGYTLGFINIPTIISLPIKRETSYSGNEIAPIINIVYDPSVIAVREDSPLSSFSAFLSECREKPYSVKIGNNGYGASNHIAAASLADKADIRVTHIPFGGSADMISALRDGNVDAIAVKISEVSEEARSGEFRLLCSFTDERMKGWEDVPTLKEYGIDLVFGSARALAAPSDTPSAIITFLHDTFRKALDELQAEDTDNTLSLKYMSTSETEEYIEEWQKYMENTVPCLPL